MEGVEFGCGRISTLDFADDIVYLASNNYLRLLREQFAVKREATGMKISTSKSEAMTLTQKGVACPLQDG